MESYPPPSIPTTLNSGTSSENTSHLTNAASSRLGSVKQKESAGAVFFDRAGISRFDTPLLNGESSARPPSSLCAGSSSSDDEMPAVGDGSHYWRRVSKKLDEIGSRHIFLACDLVDKEIQEERAAAGGGRENLNLEITAHSSVSTKNKGTSAPRQTKWVVNKKRGEFLVRRRKECGKVWRAFRHTFGCFGSVKVKFRCGLRTCFKYDPRTRRYEGCAKNRQTRAFFKYRSVVSKYFKSPGGLVVTVPNVEAGELPVVADVLYDMLRRSVRWKDWARRDGKPAPAIHSAEITIDDVGLYHFHIHVMFDGEFSHRACDCGKDREYCREVRESCECRTCKALSNKHERAIKCKVMANHYDDLDRWKSQWLVKMAGKLTKNLGRVFDSEHLHVPDIRRPGGRRPRGGFYPRGEKGRLALLNEGLKYIVKPPKRGSVLTEEHEAIILSLVDKKRTFGHLNFPKEWKVSEEEDDIPLECPHCRAPFRSEEWEVFVMDDAEIERAQRESPHLPWQEGWRVPKKKAAASSAFSSPP